MTQTITLTANQISQIISVSPGTRITSSGNGYISWVAGSLVDAKNGSGTWAEWAKGSSAGYMDAVRQMCIRATATGNMTVTLDEGRADKYPENVYFDTELASVQTNADGSVSLVGAGGEVLDYMNSVGELTVLYRFEEADGSLLVDSFDNGPDLTLAGTLGAARTANAGYLTPNGTDNYVRHNDLSGVIERIFDFRNADDSAIMFGFDIVNATDFIAAATLLGVGGAAAGDGRVRIQFATTEGLQVAGRGVGESSALAFTTAAVDTTGVTARVQVFMVFHSPVGYTYQMDVYQNGVFVNTYSLNFNSGGLATSMPYAYPNGVTLFAAESAVAGTFFNASGVSLAGLRHVFMRRATHDAAQEARIASNLYFFPGERPATLIK